MTVGFKVVVSVGQGGVVALITTDVLIGGISSQAITYEKSL
jgi:hypothetical protein